MAKNKVKVEKETRKLIEAIADLVKKKGDRYKFKSKNKKVIKKVKKTCVHWTIHKGREVPTVVASTENPGDWRCKICGTEFPIKPAELSEYRTSILQTLRYVNQMQFLSVKLGGDKEDTKMFLELRKLLPRFNKATKQILKAANKRQRLEDNRKKSDSMSQFEAYSGYNYRS